MSRDQRINDNHALIYAQKLAINLKLPLAVAFVLNKTSQTRAQEHYNFMIDGLYEIETKLKSYNIPFICLTGDNLARLQSLFYHTSPVAVFIDFNPLKGPSELANNLAKQHPILVVDTHNIVPAWIASDKQEVGARTLRPKIHKLLTQYLTETEAIKLHPYNWPNKDILNLNKVVKIFDNQLKAIPKNNSKLKFVSGEEAANKTLLDFITNRLKGYSVNRNNPTLDNLSELSPYLHFGQISSLRVILNCLRAVNNNPTLSDDYNTLLEELVIRKELSDNYCYYNQNYNALAGAPEWAQKTLAKHQNDNRDFIYTKDQFEKAQTHDEAWNAAQKQLLKYGKMHGYMRMYWAKKVFEWSESPEQALNILIYLNDFYSIDGGDPNGYVGILWSIAGLHDRPWGERSVYGTVRSMVYNGLKRKFDIEAYIQKYEI